MRDPLYPLYREEAEHESCGVGAVVDLTGKATPRKKSLFAYFATDQRQAQIQGRMYLRRNSP